jgi:metal-dependent amidase/aminoacylase/carboxypeptidase family protein
VRHQAGGIALTTLVAALVAERLQAAGLSVSTGIGGHGVVGVLGDANSGPTIAYRADMDAVNDDEMMESEFRSRRPGAAHTCGHDLHTSIGVGIAQVLARLEDDLEGQLVFVFQPAEETLTGARAMIEARILERTEPREIYALHCSPQPVGTIATMPGSGYPGQDVGHIRLSGPDAAKQAERLAILVRNLSTVTYPQTPEEATRLFEDMRMPDGPLAQFVHAESWVSSNEHGARVSVYIRAWPDDRFPKVRDDVRRLAESAGNVRVDFPDPPFPAMVCSPELSHAAAAHFEHADSVQAVEVLHASFPFNGEDFGLFLQQIPGAMLHLGVANPVEGLNGAPHTPNFGADERAIGVGVRAMSSLLASRLAALAS